MGAIFISHSSRDKAAAQEVKRRLAERSHLSVFLDLDPEQGITAGQSWERTLYRKLRSSRAVVAIVTDHYLKSSWCFAELALARMERKPIFALTTAPLSADASLPSILTEHQYVDLRANSDEGYERLWRGFEEMRITPQAARSWNPGDPPYPGLLALQEKDAPVFFGREREIEETLDILNSGRRQNLVLVVGASGSGKSSLVRAGIVPRLRQQPDRWILVGPFRPGQEPLEELAASLGTAFDRDWERVLHDLTDTRDLAKIARQYRRGTPAREATVLLVIDQFEELLGHGAEHVANRFLALLRAALDAEGTPVAVLGAIRTDFLESFQLNSDIGGIKFDSLSLGPLSGAGLRNVIEEPARLAQIELEPGMTERLIQDTGGPEALPLLAFTLRALWDRFGKDGLLEIREYEGLGGLHGAIAEEAEALFRSSLEKASEEELRTAFLAMARVTDDGRYASQPLTRDGLPPHVQDVLRRFVQNRLLTVRSDGTVGVAHEAMFRAWGRLANWLAEMRTDLLFHQQLRNAAAVWNDGARAGDELWRGDRLRRAVQLIDGARAPVTELERAFVAESVAVERATGERRQKVIAYTSLREKALTAYVSPFLRKREEELNAEITDLDTHKRVFRFRSEAEDLKQERNVLRNFLPGGGKWHPQTAEHHTNTGAVGDYVDVWRFPCCGKFVLGDEPSQFREDGCESPTSE